jgi:alcohol dehydrogenase class IV
MATAWFHNVASSGNPVADMSFAKLKHDLSIGLTGFLLRFMPGATYMVYAGEGSAVSLCKSIARSGNKRLLVVTDKPLVELGIVERALSGLEGVETVIYDGVLPDPTFQIVNEGADRYRAENCDSILAIGGGSSIDAAKTIGVAVSHEGDPRNYIGFGKVKDPIPPFYAIPTTSGTGSEATMGAVISDTKTHEKGIISGASLLPLAACLDPALMTGLPPHITAATGMDALTHAIEAYIAVWDRGDAKEKARLAVRIIFEQLPRAYAEGSDLQARDAMAHASYMAGQAINQVNVGNVHAIAHQLGGEYGIPHGMANAMVLPHVLDMSLPDARKGLAELAQVIGKNSAEEFIAAVRELSSGVGIPATVDQLREQDIIPLAARAVAEGDGYCPPHFMDMHDCTGILRKLLTPGERKS